jgi:hypothetical protein
MESWEGRRCIEPPVGSKACAGAVESLRSGQDPSPNDSRGLTFSCRLQRKEGIIQAELTAGEAAPTLAAAAAPIMTRLKGRLPHGGIQFFDAIPNSGLLFFFVKKNTAVEIILSTRSRKMLTRTSDSRDESGR